MKKIIALSAVAALATSMYASEDVNAQMAKLEAKLAKLEKRIGEVNALAAKDNVKFDVDFRTAYDNIRYETLSGQKLGNGDGIYSNRLWLNMGYAPTDEMVFKGQLAYHKAFGATAIQPSTSAMPGYPQRGMGFDTFDWISSETLNDDKLRVREAYWLWTPKVGDFGFTASVGRRPSTNGFLANLREDDPKDKSPNGHVINMEFDGASFGVKTDLLLPGMLFKICLGRGLTNAKAWANEADYTMNKGMGATSPNYIKENNALDTVDMAGFIFIPYDDGQYALKTTWYRGFSVPGMIGQFTLADNGSGKGLLIDSQSWSMQNTGDMDGMAASLKVDGIGDGISDFLDETSFFVSYARSVSHPNARTTSMVVPKDATAHTTMMNMMSNPQAAAMFGTMDQGAMMGSNDSQTGSSIWAGVNMPNMMGGKIGFEYNKGDKYWRPFTYGEDTLIGSKLATRGTAIEAYINQPLIKDVFSMQVRYTQIKYDYTGSNGFFGDGGTPYSMTEAATLNQLFASMTGGQGGFDPVEKADDLRVYFRYRY